MEPYTISSIWWEHDEGKLIQRVSGEVDHNLWADFIWQNSFFMVSYIITVHKQRKGIEFVSSPKRYWDRFCDHSRLASVLQDTDQSIIPQSYKKNTSIIQDFLCFLCVNLKRIIIVIIYYYYRDIKTVSSQYFRMYWCVSTIINVKGKKYSWTQPFL